MNKKEKRERLALISARLCELYPEAECALEYGGDPWKLLVMGRLSAQCTDKRVNIVSKYLFSRYPTPKAMAEADIEELCEIVKPCGLYRVKAQNIKDASAMLISEFGGALPATMEELLRFPGVGRKIANLLIGDIFHGPAIVCDTHCIRISNLLGLTENKAPEKVEKDLRAIVPPERGNDLCHRFVLHGRACCIARRPQCEKCCLNKICSYALAKENTQ